MLNGKKLLRKSKIIFRCFFWNIKIVAIFRRLDNCRIVKDWNFSAIFLTYQKVWPIFWRSLLKSISQKKKSFRNLMTTKTFPSTYETRKKNIPPRNSSMTVFAEANVDVDLRMLRSFRVLRPLKLVSRIPSKRSSKNCDHSSCC